MSESLMTGSSREMTKPEERSLPAELGRAAVQSLTKVVESKTGADSIPQDALANQNRGNLNGAEEETSGVWQVRPNPNSGEAPANGRQSRISPGNKGRKHSPETRAKISQAMRGENNPGYGKPLSDEHRAKLRAANKGRKHSPETRAKISEAKKGENHPSYGKPLSDEHRAKISAAIRGERNYWYDQSIEKICLAIAAHVEGKSMAQASRDQGFHKTWLTSWKRKHPERFQKFYQQAVDDCTPVAEPAPIKSETEKQLVSATPAPTMAEPDRNAYLPSPEPEPEYDPSLVIPPPPKLETRVGLGRRVNPIVRTWSGLATPEEIANAVEDDGLGAVNRQDAIDLARLVLERQNKLAG